MLASPMLLRPAMARPGAGTHAAPRSLPMARLDTVPNPVSRMRSARPLLALTFDDGPHHSLTPQVLDILAARRIRASFFVIGNRADRNPRILRRMVAEGHEIGNHTWSHPRLVGLPDAAVLAQFDRTAQVVGDIVGRAPVLMRPPYGQITPAQRQMILSERQLPTVLWSVDPEDWRRPSPLVVRQRILDQAHPGAIVLAHDIVASTVAAMPSTLDALIERGYAFVTVSELIGWPRWAPGPGQS
jgi:peptidoglycan-N-acetylglucosamine deacetylase